MVTAVQAKRVTAVQAVTLLRHYYYIVCSETSNSGLLSSEASLRQQSLDPHEVFETDLRVQTFL